MPKQRRAPKDVQRDLTTYFLAKKSGLFRPGAALMLAVTLTPKKGDIVSKQRKKDSRR